MSDESLAEGETELAAEQAKEREAGEGEDLEHDLANEALTAASAPLGQMPLTYVQTRTTDEDGDYSYDMSHDVPPA